MVGYVNSDLERMRKEAAIYYPRICMEGPNKTTKTLSQVNALPCTRFEPNAFWVQVRSVIAWATLLCSQPLASPVTLCHNDGLYLLNMDTFLKIFHTFTQSFAVASSVILSYNLTLFVYNSESVPYWSRTVVHGHLGSPACSDRRPRHTI
jgi:hypothetical protein